MSVKHFAIVLWVYTWFPITGFYAIKIQKEFEYAYFNYQNNIWIICDLSYEIPL